MFNYRQSFALMLFFVAFSSCLFGQKLVSATLLGSRTKAQLQSQLGLPIIQYGCKYYAIKYATPDVTGKLDTASGLLAIPDDAKRVYPRLVYQHGTSGSRNDVPSLNVSNGEGQLAWLFAGMGYVTIAPDYLGLGSSRGFHPYVHAKSEASAAIDMLRAVDTFCLQNGGLFNKQLFITGYSQGGHAAMALHREIEKDPKSEFVVTAAAPLSGPYSIGEVMRDLILTDKVYFFPAYIPNTILGYQTAYGNIFAKLNDVFRSPYAAEIDKFYKNSLTLTNLNTKLITLLTQTEGSCRPIKLFKDSMLTVIKNDAQHPLNKALKENNTYNNWTPKAPMRLFYCKADDQVPFMNSVLAGDTLTAAGAPNFLISDVLSTGDHGACFNPAVTQTLLFFVGFQAVTLDEDSPLAQAAQLDLSPNPMSDVLFLRNLPTAGRLQIMDADSRIIFNAKMADGDHEINTSNWPTGFYVAVFQPEKGGKAMTKVLAKTN